MTVISLNKLMCDLNGYRDSVAKIPRGKETQLFAFTDCLLRIKNTKIGGELLNRITASGKPVNIRLNANGENSAHADLTVKFDPRTQKRYIIVENGQRKIGDSSADAILFHELVHIYRFIEDEASDSCVDSSIPLTSLGTEYHKGEEWDTIHGLGRDNFSENAFRKEVGLPQRVTHRSIPPEMEKRINTVIGTKGSIKTDESEKALRGALLDIFKNGLEGEARAVIKNGNVTMSDLDFLFDVELLEEYGDRDKHKEFDSIRKHIASLFVSAAIQHKSFDPAKAEEFFSDLFGRSSFRSLDFQKKLCSFLPLDTILRSTPIVQNAIEEENTELLEFLISEKGLKEDCQILHKDSEKLLTISQYVKEIEADEDVFGKLFPEVA